MLMALLYDCEIIMQHVQLNALDGKSYWDWECTISKIIPEVMKKVVWMTFSNFVGNTRKKEIMVDNYSYFESPF